MHQFVNVACPHCGNSREYCFQVMEEVPGKIVPQNPLEVVRCNAGSGADHCGELIVVDWELTAKVTALKVEQKPR